MLSTLRRVLAWTLSGQLPARLRAWRALRRDARRIAASPLFDAAWYRATYPDLAGEADPALHYLRRGAEEGRLPGPRFDGPAYAARHPDVRLRDLNPLLHCLDHGGADAVPPPGGIPMPAMPLTEANYRLWQTWTEHPVSPVVDAPPLTVVPVPGGARADAGGGGYVLFAPGFVRRRPDAEAAIAAALAADPSADVLFADEDRLDAGGSRHAPLFKPDWDPELFAERDLIGWTGVFRERLLRPGDEADPWRAALRIVAEGGRIRHLPSVLFHASEQAPPARTAPPRAWPVPDAPPLVTLIVPTRDRAALLARCAAGVLGRTTYRNLEFLIVDNNSCEPQTLRLFASLQDDPRVRIAPYPGSFNWSAMNNRAVEAARGEVIVLLNNDIDVIDPDWLGELVSLALRPEVGAVGAKLLYPDNTVQHAGMTTAGASFGAHVYRHAAADDPGHGGMLAARRRVSAVTGACLAIRRSVYLEVGGIEERHLCVTGSDVDLCLRVRELGYQVICTPHALLYHLEAASRGLDATPAQRARVAAERAYLRERWGAMVETERFLGPSLTVVQEQLAFAPAGGVIGPPS